MANGAEKTQVTCREVSEDGPQSREVTGDLLGDVRASDGGLAVSPSLLLMTEKSRLSPQSYHLICHCSPPLL